MDARLWHVDRVRPSHLRTQDLPAVARAIVAVTRGNGLITRGFTHETAYVHMYGRGFSVVVRGDDWHKIAPYVKNGSFDPNVVAPVLVPFADPNSAYDPANIPVVDGYFYGQILGILKRLFLSSFPTSKL